MLYYQITVKIHTEGNEENERSKTVTERYLIEANSTIEAERVIAEHFKNSTFVFSVHEIKKSNIIEVIKMKKEDEE